MKRSVLVSILAALTLAPTLMADEASHREAAYRYLEASQARRSLDQAMSMVETMIAQQMDSLDLPAAGQEISSEIRKDMLTRLSDMLRWEEMSEFLVATYVDVFSEKELLGLAEFYQSELGRKVLEKQPELMQKSMAWTQQRMQEYMPTLLQSIEEATAELREKYPDE
jgi:hypothetical protein